MKKRFPFKPAAIKKFLKNSGFTLVELLVAMSLSGIIVSAVYSLFIHQNKSFIVQGQVTETQQNLRGALEIMGLDIKMAGFGFSTTGTASYYNGSGIVSLKAVDTTGRNSTSGPDSIQISYGDNALKSKLTAPMATHSDPLLVENTAGFQVNDIILISDGTNASLLQITGINALQLLHASVSGNLNPPAGMFFFPRTYVIGSWVYKLKKVTYQITNANPTHPRLEVNWAGSWTGGTFQSLAEDIEDLQIAYRDDIGIWHYTLANSTPPGNIRDVRLNLVGRARGLAPVFSGRRPALEDRPSGILDNLRRRTLTTTFMVRNLGI
jgi:type IV pilus assembly protein PilW